VGKSERTGSAFACLEATVVLGSALIAIGRDRHLAVRRPLDEGPQAAGRQGRSDRDLTGLDLGPARMREGSRGLDPLRQQQVPRLRIAPEHDATGSALPGGQLGRLLRVTWMSVRADTEVGLSGASAGDIDAMRLLAPIRRNGAKDDAGWCPTSFGLPPFVGGGP
jgi:hypothetical protein